MSFEKHFRNLLLYVLTFFAFCGDLYAQVNSNHVYVNGYYRSNGTYVEGYYRTSPNSTTNDNFSTIGNYNPYTGKAGWLIPENKSISYFNYSFQEKSAGPQQNYYNYATISNNLNEVSTTLNATYYEIKDNHSYFFYYQGKPVATTNEWKDNDLIIYFDKYAYLIPRFNEQNVGIKKNLIPLATWKVIEGNYFLFFNEENVTKETSNKWFGNDLIVYYKNYAFCLKNYNIHSDGKIRIADNLTTWKSDGMSLKFFVNGEQIVNLTSKRQYGNDLLVEYNQNVYILSNFVQQKDNQLQIARELPKWLKTSSGYSFFVNGQNVSLSTSNEWYDNNLIVYYENHGFMLPDYKNQNNNLYHIAIPIPTWSRDKKQYSFYLNGEDIAYKTTNIWYEDNLIVSYLDKYYLLPNFKKAKHGQIYFATLLL
jgi:hypothetical protein